MVNSPIKAGVFRFVCVKAASKGGRLGALVSDSEIIESSFGSYIITPFANLFMVTEGMVTFSICKETPEFGIPIFIKKGEYLLIPANIGFRFSNSKDSILILLPMVLPEDPAYNLALVLAP